MVNILLLAPHKVGDRTPEGAAIRAAQRPPNKKKWYSVLSKQPDLPDAGAPSQQSADHRRGAGGLYRSDLRGARQFATDSGHRTAAGRPADDHDRCRELSGVRGDHPG